MQAADLRNMGMIDEGHLGGFLIEKDPATFMPHLWKYLCDKFKVKSVLDVGLVSKTYSISRTGSH